MPFESVEVCCRRNGGDVYQMKTPLLKMRRNLPRSATLYMAPQALFPPRAIWGVSILPGNAVQGRGALWPGGNPRLRKEEHYHRTVHPLVCLSMQT